MVEASGESPSRKEKHMMDSFTSNFIVELIF